MWLLSLWKGKIRTQRHTHTEGRWCEDAGRRLSCDYDDTWTSQGMPRIFGRKLEEARKISPLETSELGSADTLISTSGFQNCETNTFLFQVTWFLILCYGCPRMLNTLSFYQSSLLFISYSISLNTFFHNNVLALQIHVKSYFFCLSFIFVWFGLILKPNELFHVLFLSCG